MASPQGSRTDVVAGDWVNVYNRGAEAGRSRIEAALEMDAKRMNLQQLPTLLLALGLVLSLAACGSGDGAESKPGLNTNNPKVNRARYGNLKTDGYEPKEFDLNLDGKPDQWKYAAGGTVVRIERDLNFDGIADVFEYPNAQGEIVEEEMDLDVDGVVDVVNYYRAGVLHRKEMAVDFSGAFSVVKYYDTLGKLTRVERDSTGNNRVDTWEYFQDDEKIRTGRDINGDGTPDLFEDVGEDN
jgi:hypothetical protein